MPVARTHGIVAGVLLGILAATYWLVLAGTARLAWFRLRARAAFRADGGRPPGQARELAVIEGQLRCVGEPVSGPLTGRPAAVWEYEVRGPAPDGDGACAWSGCGQAPCEVVTRSGAVPVRAGLLLHGLPWDTVRRGEARPRIDRLLAETPFERIDGRGGAQRMFTTLDRALDAPFGGRFDTRRGVDPREGRFSARERILTEGVTVTLLGPYRPDDGLLPLQELIVGPAEAVVRGFVQEVAVAAAFTAAFSATQGFYFWAVFGSG